MRVAYGFNSIAKYGSGQVIALVDAYDDPNAEADLGTFNTEFKLPACTTANGCFRRSWPLARRGHHRLDQRNRHRYPMGARHRPGRQDHLVEAKSSSNADLYAAVDLAVAHGATMVSMSWGGGEASNEATADSHFEVTGVTFVAGFRR
jgi:hypothetical protein